MAKSNQSVERVKTDLEIDEHLLMQERGWRVQAAGLYFLYSLVLTAALGLFGDGLISNNKSQQNEVQVEHERFYRFEAPMEIKVELKNVTGENITISFPHEYLKSFEVESIVPEPDKNISKGNMVQYIFNGTGNMNITFYFTPRTVGITEGSIEVNNNRFALNHFIFP
jgi:hypothetical protein